MNKYTFDGFQARYIREATRSVATSMLHDIAAKAEASFRDEAAFFAVKAFADRVREMLASVPSSPRLITSDAIRDQIMSSAVTVDLSEKERFALENAVLHRVYTDGVQTDGAGRSALDMITGVLAS